MELRAVLQLLCAGVVMASAVAPAEALTSVMPDRQASVAPEPGVATSEDIDRAKVEKAWYGHWRRASYSTLL